MHRIMHDDFQIIAGRLPSIWAAVRCNRSSNDQALLSHAVACTQLLYAFAIREQQPSASHSLQQTGADAQQGHVRKHWPS